LVRIQPGTPLFITFIKVIFFVVLFLKINYSIAKQLKKL